MILYKIFDGNQWDYYREDGTKATNQEIEIFLTQGLSFAERSTQQMIDEDRQAVNEEKAWRNELRGERDDF